MKKRGSWAFEWLMRSSLVVGMTALVAGTGCDETGYGDPFYGDYYGWTEYGDDGSTRSFSFGPGISAEDAVDTYLSDSVIYP